MFGIYVSNYMYNNWFLFFSVPIADQRYISCPWSHSLCPCGCFFVFRSLRHWSRMNRPRSRGWHIKWSRSSQSCLQRAETCTCTPTYTLYMHLHIQYTYVVLACIHVHIYYVHTYDIHTDVQRLYGPTSQKLTIYTKWEGYRCKHVHIQRKYTDDSTHQTADCHSVS